jgi:dephospho-CoA kinase
MKTFTIGITGGIGSGKSTVCWMFNKLGVEIFEADTVAKKIMNNNRAVKFKIQQAFGKDCYDENGLDRKYLAAKVFKDKEELEILNGIVHPYVYMEFDKGKRQGHPILIMESAIMFQTEYYKKLDKTIYVDSPLEMRIARAMERDGAKYEDVVLRINNQDKNQTNKDKADHFINNDGELDDLKDQVLEIWNKIVPR